MIEASMPPGSPSVNRSTVSPSGVLPNGRQRIRAAIRGSLPRHGTVDRGNFAHVDDDAGCRPFRAPTSPTQSSFCRRVGASAFFASGTPVAVAARRAGSTFSADRRLLRRARARAPAARRGARRRAADRRRARRRSQRWAAHRVRRGDARACIARRARSDVHRPGRVGRLRARPGRASRPRARPWPFAGLRVLVSSSIPEAKGLGSSAAVEVAVLHAAAACLGAGRGSRSSRCSRSAPSRSSPARRAAPWTRWRSCTARRASCSRSSAVPPRSSRRCRSRALLLRGHRLRAAARGVRRRLSPCPLRGVHGVRAARARGRPSRRARAR